MVFTSSTYGTQSQAWRVRHAGEEIPVFYDCETVTVKVLRYQAGSLAAGGENYAVWLTHPERLLGSGVKLPSQAFLGHL